MHPNEIYKTWKKHCEGKQVVTIRLDDNTIVNYPILFKDHRGLVEHFFSRQGFQVTRHMHEYSGPLDNPRIDKWGLVYHRTDSDLQLMLEVSGIVGENILPLEPNG